MSLIRQISTDDNDNLSSLFEITESTLEQLEEQKHLKYIESLKKKFFELVSEEDSLQLRINQTLKREINCCYPLSMFKDIDYIMQQELICGICGNVVRYAFQNRNGIMVGADCLINSIEGRDYCDFQQVLKTEMDPKAYYEHYNPDNRARKQILMQQVQCLFCPSIMKLSILEDHLKYECQGCSSKCDKCGESMRINYQNEHSINCVKRLTQCKNCEDKIDYDKLFNHYIENHLYRINKSQGSRSIYTSTLNLQPTQKYLGYKVIKVELPKYCKLEDDKPVHCDDCSSLDEAPFICMYAWQSWDKKKHLCLYCGCRGKRAECVCGDEILMVKDDLKCMMCRNQSGKLSYKCGRETCKFQICNKCRCILID